MGAVALGLAFRPVCATRFACVLFVVASFAECFADASVIFVGVDVLGVVAGVVVAPPCANADALKPRARTVEQSKIFVDMVTTSLGLAWS